MRKKTAYMGLFLALALICSYIESFFSFGIPGIKLGLTNIVVVWLLYLAGAKEAFLISMLRIILSGFMFTNLFSILYSLAGGISSFLVMFLLKKTNKLKCISISLCGGITHNIAQIILAVFIVNSINVLFYIPVLLISGMITGLIIGIISQEMIIRLRNRFRF